MAKSQSQEENTATATRSGEEASATGETRNNKGVVAGENQPTNTAPRTGDNPSQQGEARNPFGDAYVVPTVSAGGESSGDWGPGEATDAQAPAYDPGQVDQPVGEEGQNTTPGRQEALDAAESRKATAGSESDNATDSERSRKG